MDTFWLMFSGAVTAIPLILFSAGAKRIPLSLTGFIQYVGPTIMFFLGIFAFKEHFDANNWLHSLSFGSVSYCTVFLNT